MDRKVPTTGSDDIELYMRTYYSLLRSTHTIQIDTLEEVHRAMNSTLHVGALSPHPDISALVYASLRLPLAIVDCNMIILGQIERSFLEAGYQITEWTRVQAPGRRRRSHFDGQNTLATFIVSRSDIDDLIPMLTAYQIEWNKLHVLLQAELPRLFLDAHQDRTTRLTEAEVEMLAQALFLEDDELRRLEVAWGAHFYTILSKMAKSRKHFSLRLIAGSLTDYRRATAIWWDSVAEHIQTMNLESDAQHQLDLSTRPVYFVSSNTHSLINLMLGIANRAEEELIQYLEDQKQTTLLEEYRTIEKEKNISNRSNFLYYVLKKYLSSEGQDQRERILAEEREIGIYRIPSKHGVDIETQVFDLSKLRADWLDPRLTEGHNYDWVRMTDALIVNIDYPLGLGAYEILTRLSERVAHLEGVYVMGKAATLNGRIGDVMIPNVVHDEHSANTYLFNNCFDAASVAPYMNLRTVMDNQKAISTPGTFLQNPVYMDVFYREGFTIIEMEAGPYLSAIYESVRPKRHPQNEIVNLYAAPFDVGFLHYASDTPFTKGHNLGASSLSYAGMEPTYATSVAILSRIFEQEQKRLQRTLKVAQPQNGVFSGVE